MSEIDILKKDQFENKVLNADKPVLVDFSADWCGPCKMLAPILEELKDSIGDRAKIFKVDVDNEGDLAGEYDVSGVPTMIFFNEGEEVDRMVGVRQKEELEEKINSIGS